jgi:hypothetical protein
MCKQPVRFEPVDDHEQEKTYVAESEYVEEPHRNASPIAAQRVVVILSGRVSSRVPPVHNKRVPALVELRKFVWELVWLQR